MRNILVVRNDRFGELLLIIPALRLLKNIYPDSKITLAVSPQVNELAKSISYVDEVFEWDSIKGRLRQRRFDLCAVFNPSKESHIAVFLAGIPIRAGYDRKWGFLLTHKKKDTKHLGDRHEVICNLELVECLVNQKIFVKSAVPDFNLSISDSEKYNYLYGVTAIHPFTSDQVKQWPVERFMELVDKISQEMNVRVVLVGKTAEGDTLLRRVSPSDRIINLINKTSLLELAQVLKQCKLLVTCDSGPMHLAAAVGTPVLALFRDDLPGKAAKRWGPWGAGHSVIERSKLEDISLDEVMSRVKEKLGL